MNFPEGHRKIYKMMLKLCMNLIMRFFCFWFPAQMPKKSLILLPCLPGFLKPAGMLLACWCLSTAWFLGGSDFPGAPSICFIYLGSLRLEKAAKVI